MNFKRIPLILAVSVIACMSCNNTVKILAPYKDISVVYGLMDQNDTIHYIRINKAFEGAGNAYTMAQVYDSIYYPVSEINAVLEDSNTSTGLVTTIKLDTNTTVPLGPGTFSNPKQLLYDTKAALNPNDYYNLVVTNTKTGKKLYGSTNLLPDLYFTQPSNFASSAIFSLSFLTQYPTQISWNTAAGARIYQLDIRLYYKEVQNNVTTLKSIDWLFAPIIAANSGGNIGLSYSLNGQGLCTLLLSSLPINQYITRYIDSVGVIFTSGSDDLNTYVQLSQPPTGINQDVPSFSDIRNGIGLFTSRHVQTLNKLIGNSDLIDTLTTEARYIPLNFQK
jgi:hypothetical protein